MKNDKEHSESDADYSSSDYHRTITDEERAKMMALHERMKSEQTEAVRMACRKKIAELDAMLKAIEAELDRFEQGERLRGNPAAVAGRPPAEWDLPPEMEALYDRQEEIALWRAYIDFSELPDVWE
jgi:hypothetical protein